MIERTLGIVKPDAVASGETGKILDMIESNGFSIIAMKKIKLSKHEAEKFYYVHRERPFFASLTDFMSSGPVVVMVLEKENAIADYRELMGATNPSEAGEGTIRRLFGSNIERNAVHGSDSESSASFEIGFFFSQLELV